MEILGLQEIAKSVAKSGSVVATDVALNGVLTPKQGRAFAQAIVDNSALLKEITVDIAGKLTKNRTALSSSKGNLVRVIAGKRISEEQLKKLGTIGATLTMINKVGLQTNLTDEALEDNADNPNFEKEYFDGLSVTFGNDLVYLGWVGTADNDSADAPFNELAKGWLSIAAESSDTAKATLTPEDGEDRGKFVERCLQKLCDIAHEDITDDMNIYLNSRDYSAYIRMISKDYKALSLLKSGELATFEGRKLKPQKGMPQGSFLGTPPKNMVFGISKQMSRKRWYDNDIDSLVYKFGVRPDYEFDIEKYVATVVEG